ARPKLCGVCYGSIPTWTPREVSPRKSTKLSMMAQCATCGSDISVTSRFCPSCGAEVDSSATKTVAINAPRPASVPRTSSSSRSQGRFAPGELLGGRYRIVALLGKGGMGEVYRADDLSLDQPVALKFLPEAVTHNEHALERFRNEVRI